MALESQLVVDWRAYWQVGTHAMPPSARRADATRDAIRAAAEAMFAERGFRETRLEDVAERVGIRRASLLYHFSSKADLYAAVFESMLDDLRIRAIELRRQPAAHDAMIDRMLGSWVRFVFERPAFARLLMREMSGTRSIPIGTFARLLLPVMAETMAVVRDGIAHGDFRDVDPMDFVLTIAGASLVKLLLGPVVAPDAYGGSLDTRIAAHERELRHLAHLLLGTAAHNPTGEESHP
jgi:TetR/AcrR family transcriptional regulator